MLVLATLMIPDQLRLVPVFQMLSNFPLFHWNLINTYQGYILISVVTAVNLFLMRQYFLTIPRIRGGRAARRGRPLQDVLAGDAAARRSRASGR